MPQFVITAPDGRKFKVNAPEGATKEQALGRIQEQYKAAPVPEQVDYSQEEPSGFLAGAGKAFTDLGLGAKQALTAFGGAMLPEGLPQPVTVEPLARQLQAEAALKEQADAPLMEMRGSSTGQFVGNLAAAVPALAIPGANTLLGASLVGSAQGALQPTTQEGQRTFNASLGAVLGGTGQKIGGAMVAKAGEKAAARTAAAEAAEAAGAGKDKVAARAIELGYKIPPTTANPTVAGRVLESISGKAATQQAVALANQKITNALVREELGLAADTPITREALGKIRATAGKVYAEIAASGKIKADPKYLDEIKAILVDSSQIAKDFPGADIGAASQVRQMVKTLSREAFDSKAAVAYIKALRSEASGNLRAATIGGDPTRRALGQAQRDAAAALEDVVMRHLKASGKGEMADAFDGARKTIAKTYSVEAALRGSDVMGGKLASMLGKKPLSGRLKEIADIAAEFPDVVRTPKGSPGVSAVDALIAGGGLAAGSPALLALPAGRYAARSAILSNAYQRNFLAPSYGPNNQLLQLIQSSGRGLPVAAPALGFGIDPEQE